MKKIFIDIHSYVDIITNSSTEIFICDTDKTLELVRSLVYEIEKKFPNEYGHKLSVDYADSYEIENAFGYIDEENAINILKAKGYTITPPIENGKSSLISISAERGGMDYRVKDFIESFFNVIDYTSEG